MVINALVIRSNWHKIIGTIIPVPPNFSNNNDRPIRGYKNFKIKEKITKTRLAFQICEN